MPLVPRRWLIVAALFLVTYGMATPLAAFGVFLPVLSGAFGWSRGAISAALSLNLVVGGLAGFALGTLADRQGPRAALVFTVGLACLSFGLVAAVQALWQLYLLVGLLGGVGMSSFYLLSASTVIRWFDAGRGLALGIVLMGFNLGYLSSGPLAAWLIETAGWRVAYAALGGGSAVITVLAAVTVREPRAGEIPTAQAAAGDGAARHAQGGAPSPASGVTLRAALADPRFWFLNLSWLLEGGVATMLTVHVVPFARDRGITLAEASLAITTYGIGSAVGRLAMGAVSDRVGTVNAVRAGYLVQIAGLVLLRSAPSRAALLAAMFAFGLGFAGADTMITKVIPEVFGVRAIGAVMGVLSLGWRCGAAAGPAVAGFAYDASGSYALPFGAAPIAVLASWACFALGRRRRAR